MKYKKIVALVIASAISLGTLVGCGNSDSVSTDSTEEKTSQVSEETSVENSVEKEKEESNNITFPLTEKMTFTAFTSEYNGTDLSERLSFVEFMENSNIEIEFISTLPEESQEKRNVLLSSGEYPDFFIKDNFTDVQKYAEEGEIIPLEDMIREYAPNLCAVLDERNAWGDLASLDGHIYSLPMISSQRGTVVPIWINKKWLDNLGMSEPESIEDFYNILVAFKEKDANGNGDPDDEIPLALNTAKDIKQLLNLQDYCYDHSTRLAVKSDGELVYLAEDESYKEFLEFAAKLYDEGLIYEDCYTTDRATLQALGQSADIMGCFPETASFQMVGRDNDDDYVMIMPWHGKSYLDSGITSGAMCISDKCENPEVLIAWIDYLYSEEGGKLAYMGIEGISYEFYEDGTWGWIVGNEYGDNIDTVRANVPMQGGFSIPVLMPKAWTSLMSPLIDEDESYLNVQREKLVEHSQDAFPVMKYSSEDKAELSVLKTDIEGYVDQYTAKVIIGELDLKESWEDYLNTLEKMGVERLYEIYKTAYDDGMAARN